MEKSLKIAIIGGDRRQLAAARELKARGAEPVIFGFDHHQESGDLQKAGSLSEALAEADAVLLPLPYSPDGTDLNAPFSAEKINVTDVLSLTPEYAVILAGKVAQESDPRFADYAAREEFAVWNAIPTAEGALAIVMEEMPITVRGMRVAITGFGRVGRATAALFRAVGADVTVLARNVAALAGAEGIGCRAVPLSERTAHLGGQDCVVNTVPEPIFDEETLRALRPGTLLLDLASAPGGVDLAAARRYDVRAMSALSLPGKMSPDTAGEIVCRTVWGILRERGLSI